MTESQLSYIEDRRGLIDNPNFSLEEFAYTAWDDWGRSHHGYRNYLEIMLPLAFLMNIEVVPKYNKFDNTFILDIPSWKEPNLSTIELDYEHTGEDTPGGFISSLRLPQQVKSWLLAKIKEINV